MNDVQSWHRQPGESSKAYHAFTHYRDMAPHERSFTRAFVAHQVTCRGYGQTTEDSPNDRVLIGKSREPNLQWRNWKRAFNWETRADEFDAWTEQEQRRKQQAAIDAMNERHASLATAIQGRVVERLNQLTQADPATGKTAPLHLSPGQLITWLKEATAIERRARGQATEIVETVKPKARDLSALSDAELQEYERLTLKAMESRKDAASA